MSRQSMSDESFDDNDVERNADLCIFNAINLFNYTIANKIKIKLLSTNYEMHKCLLRASKV